MFTTMNENFTDFSVYYLTKNNYSLYVTLDRNYWRVLVNVALNLWVS